MTSGTVASVHSITSSMYCHSVLHFLCEPRGELHALWMRNPRPEFHCNPHQNASHICVFALACRYYESVSVRLEDVISISETAFKKLQSRQRNVRADSSSTAIWFTPLWSTRLNICVELECVTRGRNMDCI